MQRIKIILLNICIFKHKTLSTLESMLKSKRIFFQLSLLFIFSLDAGCYDIVINYDLTIVNKLNKTISVDYQNGPTPAPEGNLVAFYTGDDQQIQPDSVWSIPKTGGKKAWHDFIEYGKTKTLYIYVFETDSLKQYEERLPIAVLINQHKYLKQLRFTEDALKKADWKITVTP